MQRTVLERLGLSLAVAHVFEHGHEIVELSVGAPDRGHRQVAPEGAAVLLDQQPLLLEVLLGARGQAGQPVTRDAVVGLEQV